MQANNMAAAQYHAFLGPGARVNNDATRQLQAISSPSSLHDAANQRVMGSASVTNIKRHPRCAIISAKIATTTYAQRLTARATSTAPSGVSPLRRARPKPKAPGK